MESVALESEPRRRRQQSTRPPQQFLAVVVGVKPAKPAHPPYKGRE